MRWSPPILDVCGRFSHKKKKLEKKYTWSDGGWILPLPFWKGSLRHCYFAGCKGGKRLFFRQKVGLWPKASTHFVGLKPSPSRRKLLHMNWTKVRCFSFCFMDGGISKWGLPKPRVHQFCVTSFSAKPHWLESCWVLPPRDTGEILRPVCESAISEGYEVSKQIRIKHLRRGVS